MPAAGLSRRRLLASVAGAGTLAAAGAATVTAFGLPRLGADGADRAGGGEPAQLRLATGPPGGVYREIGAGLLTILAQRFPGTRLMEIQTEASVANLELLDSDGTDLAFAYLDATVAGLRAARPADTAAVARIYDAWMHVVVLASSPYSTLADLDGRRITAGATGSGTRFTTDRLIAVANIRPDIVDAGQADGAELLASGRVDAMMSLTGIPTPAISRLAASMPLRMLSLGSYTEAMTVRHDDFYAPVVLPSSMYPGVAEVETLTVPNLLLASPQLPEHVVEVVASALFAQRAQIARTHPEANRINVRTAIATAPVRLHPGALRHYRSVKR